MDQRLALIKCITLLYLESTIPNNSDRSVFLVKQLSGFVKNTYDPVIASEMGGDVIGDLKGTITWLLNMPLAEIINRRELLQRVRVNVGREEHLYKALEETIDHEYQHDALIKQCASQRASLNENLAKIRFAELINDTNQKLRYHPDTIDWDYFVKDHQEKLEPFLNMGSITKSKPVAVLDFSDLDASKEFIEQAGKELSAAGIIKFGVQGINRMFGCFGGGRRGECVSIQALQHKHKTGTMNLLMTGHALYNDPSQSMRDPTKKPLIILFSTEDELMPTANHLYKRLKEIELNYEVDIDPRSVPDREKLEYIASRMQATGYKFVMRREDPSEFTYRKFIDVCEEYIAEGYEIHGIYFDYVPMMSKKGLDNSGPTGSNLRELVRRMKNWTSPRGIFFASPWQLSTEAQALNRQDIGEDFVKQVADKGYTDGCKTVTQEFDFEIVQHIVKHNGIKYLAMHRGKHRGLPIMTPEKDIFVVYRFYPIGGIRDDINGADLALKHVGGNPGGGNGQSFF